jgi:hypothetical protein
MSDISKKLDVVKLLYEGKIVGASASASDDGDGGGGEEATATVSATATNANDTDSDHRTQMSLISLPVCDVELSQALNKPLEKRAATHSSASKNNDEEEEEANPTYILMELSSPEMLQTMLKNPNKTYIVGHRSRHDDDDDHNCDENDCGSDSDSGDDDAITSNNNLMPKKSAMLHQLEHERQHQARLVLEEFEEGGGGQVITGGKSFAINKVDTSNALIVVSPQIPKPPPVGAGAAAAAADNNNSNKNDDPQQHLQLMGRLVTPSEFLELLPRPFVHLPYLKELLQRDTTLRRYFLTTASSENDALSHPSSLKRRRIDNSSTKADKSAASTNNNQGKVVQGLHNNNGKGRGRGWSLEHLSTMLQCSQAQTLKGLQKMHAYSWTLTTPSSGSESETGDEAQTTTTTTATTTIKKITTTRLYTLLPEELQQETMMAILAVLTEHPELLLDTDTDVDDASNTNKVVVPLQFDNCVELVLQLLTSDETSMLTDDQVLEVKQHLGGFDTIIRHCLHGILAVAVADNDKESQVAAAVPVATTLTLLDMDQVAIEVAHVMFLSASSAMGVPVWLQSQSTTGTGSSSLEEFQFEWMRRMPGSSSEPPTLDLLKGVAIATIPETTEEEDDDKDTTKSKPPAYNNPYKKKKMEDEPTTTANPCLTYLPERHMSMDCKERFAALFNIQKEWKVGQLNPYVAPLLTMGALPTKVTTMAELLFKFTRASDDSTPEDTIYTGRE